MHDFFAACTDEFELALQEEAEAVDRVDIEWIAYRYDQAALPVADGDHFETARISRADLVDYVGRDELGGEIDPIHLGVGSQAARNVRVRNNALFNEQIDGVAAAVEARLCILDLGPGDE